MIIATNHFQIRDPIHGVIFISPQERAIIDSFAFQRLRYIKQLGFADFAFPCASHSRYSHSLGAMYVASKIFDRVIKEDMVSPFERIKMRQAVRLSALLHDIGHPPLSHTTEMLLPDVLPVHGNTYEKVKATHEDFTYRIIVDSPLTKIIDDNFYPNGITPHMIASLICVHDQNDVFKISGLNYLPILRQIISSEIDADRMDYLLRDSFFCGVNYGKFDSDWLIENLIAVERNDEIFLGFKARALFAFEDFLLSRYHMFLSVYLHHTPVIMEKMLERFFKECPESFDLPTDVEKYLQLNDLDLWQVLRKSNNPWAQRIVHRNPYVMLKEQLLGLKHNCDEASSHEEHLIRLRNANIDSIMSNSFGILSTYFGKNKAPLFVESAERNAVALEEYSPLFFKYQSPVEIRRIFVDAKDRVLAEKIVRSPESHLNFGKICEKEII